MRHRRLVSYVAIGWLLAVGAAIAAVGASELVWLLPIAVGATIALAIRATRTLAWALPVATVVGMDSAADWPRIGLALVTVVAAIAAVGTLDAWSDAGPDRAVAPLLDPAGLVTWRSVRRPAATRLLWLLCVAAGGWTAATAVSWSSPGWLVAMVPTVAALAVAAATWPLWRPASSR